MASVAALSVFLPRGAAPSPPHIKKTQRHANSAARHLFFYLPGQIAEKGPKGICLTSQCQFPGGGDPTDTHLRLFWRGGVSPGVRAGRGTRQLAWLSSAVTCQRAPDGTVPAVIYTAGAFQHLHRCSSAMNHHSDPRPAWSCGNTFASSEKRKGDIPGSIPGGGKTFSA